MGMGYDDFCRMRPSEFREACQAYADKQEREMRNGWEVMRMQATLLVNPWLKKKLTPVQLIPLPWDGKHYTGDERTQQAKPSTRERFEKMVRKLEGC